MDPFTAIAAVKAAVAAGKELVNVTKQIGEFFDGVDELREKHNKKKNSAFSGGDENAMETFVQLQRAKDEEENLRQIIISTRGYSAWGELIELRSTMRRERKAREEEQAKLKAERMEALLIWGGAGVILMIIAGFAVVIVLGSQGKL
jgi:hypothetical protein